MAFIRPINMQRDTKPVVTEGWGVPKSSYKAHYFQNLQSLCHLYIWEHRPGASLSPSSAGTLICKTCQARRLESTTSIESTTSTRAVIDGPTSTQEPR